MKKDKIIEKNSFDSPKKIGGKSWEISALEWIK
jgi:hypothetical protein